MLALSALQGMFGGGTILSLSLLVYKWLDAPYTNMTLAAAREEDEAGLHCLHHIYRWVIARLSAPSQDLTSGMELVSLDNVYLWLSDMVRAITTLYMI